MSTETMYATCEDCSQPMRPRGGCTLTHVAKRKNGPWIKRIVLGQESEDWGSPCHDCNVGSGQPHHAGCDTERCPGCGGQMMMCLGPPDPEFGGCGWLYLRKEA